MATVTPSVTDIGPSTRRVVWTGMVTGDTIVAHLTDGTAVRATVQGSGTFAGGTVIGLTGSVNDTTFIALTDDAGSALTGKTAAFLVGVGPVCTSFAPTIGSGTADSVTVTLVYTVI